MHRAPIRILALVAVVAACGRSDAPQGGDLPCGGNASGGFSLTDLADATYSVSFSEATTRGESMHIPALFVGRGAPGWKGRAQGSATRPVRPDTTVPLAGASLGRLYMGYEDRTNTAWVHDQRVPLDSFNI